MKAQAAVSAATEIPFEYHEGLLWIKASIPQSTNSLNLLLDTGAGVSVIHSATARRLGLQYGRAATVHGVETTFTAHWIKIDQATANEVPLPSQYLAVDLKGLSRSCERPVDGLVGADFFRGRIVQLDFDASKLRILSEIPTPRCADSLSLQTRPCGMRVPISVNGRPRQWVRLDTGCATALQWVTSQVRPDDCKRQVAIGLAQLSIPQTETAVQIAGHTFNHVQTGIHSKPIFAGEAGLLGNGLLSRFSKITIDTRSGRLVLEPKPATK